MDNIEKKESLKKGSLNIRKGPLSLLKKMGSMVFAFCTYGILAITLALLLSYFAGGGDSIRVFGYSSFFIETSSMELVMPAGTLVFTKENPDGHYEVGDDISFFASYVNGRVVTHRVVEVTEDEEGTTVYITKGTNNPENDTDPVYIPNIIGKVVFTIPEVGIYVDYIKENLVISLAFIATFVFIIVYLFKEVKKMIVSKKEDKNIESNPNKIEAHIIESSGTSEVIFKENSKHRFTNLFNKNKNRNSDKTYINSINEVTKKVLMDECYLNIIMDSDIVTNALNESLFEFIVATPDKTNRMILKSREKITLILKPNDEFTLMFKNNLDALGYEVDISQDHGVSVAGNTIDVFVKVREKKKTSNPRNQNVVEEDIEDFDPISEFEETVVNPMSSQMIKKADNKLSIKGNEVFTIDDIAYSLNGGDISLLNHPSDNLIDSKESIDISIDEFDSMDRSYETPKHAIDYISFKLVLKHFFDVNTNRNDDVISHFKVFDNYDLTRSFTLSMKGEGVLESDQLRFYEAGVYTFYIICLDHQFVKFTADPSLYKLKVEVAKEQGKLFVKSQKYTCSNKLGVINIPLFITMVL